MRRLGIFCFHEPQGIVDDYVLYLLESLCPFLERLRIVCNGRLSDEGRRRLSGFSGEIMERPNEGFDMGAWRAALIDEGSELAAYDELLLFNDSFYGPLYPWDEVFDAMAAKPSLDFWGLTIHGRAEDPLRLSPYGFIPEHIQSYFLVIRRRLLEAPAFLAYWKEALPARDFEEAVLRHEAVFTRRFSDLGYAYGAYCDTRAWEEGYDVKVNHYLFSQLRLLRGYRCPVLKRKALTQPRSFYLTGNYGDEPRRSLAFIAAHTGYDVSLIYRHLLRTRNVSDIKENLGLNYVLPTEAAPAEPTEEMRKAAVVVHLYYADTLEDYVPYLAAVPTAVSLYVTTDTADKKAAIECLLRRLYRPAEVRVVNGRGRDLSALLVGCRDVLARYEYVCFCHDKKSRRAGQSIATGEAFSRLLWDNTLASPGYIGNVLLAFRREPVLGLLTPPAPRHGEYRDLAGDYWTGLCYEQTLKLAGTLAIPVAKISAQAPPLALGSFFWCRSRALRRLWQKEWRPEDFPAEPMPPDGTISHALERIFPFVAQAEGFYTGWMMTADFAGQMLENELSLSAAIPRQAVLKALVKRYVPHRYWPILYRLRRLLRPFLPV